MNCLVGTNEAFIDGGGTYNANLFNCIVTSNRLVQGAGGGGVAFGVVSNCVITQNTGPSGGGTWCSVVYNSTISNNFAPFGGGTAFGVINNSLIISNYASLGGGGAYSNSLNNCILAYNFANGSGGGAYKCALNNCTVVSNVAAFAPAAALGGGVFFGTATNCIIYYNHADKGSNYYSTSNFQLSYCCTWPMPTNGFGNITNAPGFVNLLTGNYHLQATSPCINNGNNLSAALPMDLDGNPRIMGGTVDMGAYEFQTPASAISYAYLEKYGLPTDGSVDSVDSDGDGFSNVQEWRAGTSPIDAASKLQMASVAPSNNLSGVTVTWQSVSGVTYYLLRSTNLPVFSIVQSKLFRTGGFYYFYGILRPSVWGRICIGWGCSSGRGRMVGLMDDWMIGWESIADF